jgi:hypothetical protein
VRYTGKAVTTSSSADSMPFNVRYDAELGIEHLIGR